MSEECSREMGELWVEGGAKSLCDRRSSASSSSCVSGEVEGGAREDPAGVAGGA